MAKPQSAPTPTETLAGDAAQAFAAFAEHGRGAFEAAVRTWGEETHAFLEAMARDGATAFEQLQKCKSPVDAIAVEQAWLMARSKAYMDAGRRILESAVASASPPGNEAAGFRLPE